MTRPFDWPERLMAALAARRDLPFAWGKNDCALFACDIAQAVCGVDFAAPLRGRYKTRRGAYGALKRFAGGGLEEAAVKIAADHGRAEVAPLMAQRGDLVLLETATGPALGICTGTHIAAPGAQGTELAPLDAGTRAWRV